MRKDSRTGQKGDTVALADSGAGVTPGKLLREKREDLALSVEQVAHRLRLRLVVIEAIENDDFNIDKVATFVRGYIKSYAKLVGVSESKVLDAFDQLSDPRWQEPITMRSFSRKESRRQHNSWINLLTCFVITTLIGISSFWWYKNQQGTVPPQLLTPKTEKIRSHQSPSTLETTLKKEERLNH